MKMVVHLRVFQKKFTINNKIKKDSDGRIDNQIINNRFSQDQIIKFLEILKILSWWIHVLFFIKVSYQ